MNTRWDVVYTVGARHRHTKRVSASNVFNHFGTLPTVEQTFFA